MSEQSIEEKLKEAIDGLPQRERLPGEQFYVHYKGGRYRSLHVDVTSSGDQPFDGDLRL
jgi:hypothetical protein